MMQTSGCQALMIMRSLTLLIASILTGCSSLPQPDYGKLGLVEISGTVTLDGEPVSGAAVYFMEPDEKFCFGVTDSEGRYRMMLNSQKSGVTPGAKRVEITTVRNPLGEAAGLNDDDGQARSLVGQVERIPSCYTGKNSPICVVIKEPNRALNFELNSDCREFQDVSRSSPP